MKNPQDTGLLLQSSLTSEGAGAGQERSAAFRFVFLIFLGLHVGLIASLRLYPLVDLPNHLAASTIYRYGSDPASPLAQTYAVDTLLKPNAAHLVFCASELFPTVEMANRAFYGLYTMLLPLATLLLIRRVDGNPWYSLLSFLYLYNYSFRWGFSAYTISIPLLLIYFAILLDALPRRSIWTRVLLAAMSALFFFVHALAALFSLGLFLLCVLFYHRRSLRRMVAELWVLVPLLALAGVWWLIRDTGHSYPNTLGYLANYYRDEYLPSLASRLLIPFLDHPPLWGGALGIALALGLSLCAVVPVLGGLIRNPRPSLQALTAGNRPALLAFFSLSLLCCAVLPHGLPMPAFIYQRFSVFVFLALVLIGSVLPRLMPNKRLALALSAVCLVHLVLWTHYFVGFQWENSGFRRDLFPENARNQRSAGLIFDGDYRGWPVYKHFQDYQIIWNQGVATTSLVDYRLGHVKRKVSTQVLPEYLDWLEVSDTYDGRYRDMDFILVRGEVPEDARDYLADWACTRQAGLWCIYERTGRP